MSPTSRKLTYCTVGVVLAISSVDGYGQTIIDWVGANGSGGSGEFTKKNDWSPRIGSGPGVIGRFSGAGGSVLIGNPPQRRAISGLQFESSAGGYSYSGTGVALEIGASGIVNDSTVTQTFLAGVNLSADQTWTMADQSQMEFDALDIGGNLLQLTGAGGGLASVAALSGSGNLAVENATLQLTGDTSGFTGNLGLLGGGLEFNTDFSTAGNLLVTGGSMVFRAETFSVGSFSLSGNVSISLDNVSGASQSINLGIVDYISGSMLISGWTPDANLNTFSFSSPPSAEFLQSVTFEGFGTGAQIVNGYLVPVPEPGAIALLLSGGLLLFVVRSRNTRR